MTGRSAHRARSAFQTKGLAVARSAAAYFAIVFAAGFALGSVRVPFLVPRWGERLAELAETPLMLAVIYLAAGYVVRRVHPPHEPRGLVMVGLMALSCMIAAELLLAVVMAERSVAEYIASRDPVSGTVYLAMLAVFAAMPWLRRNQAHATLRRRNDGA